MEGEGQIGEIVRERFEEDTLLVESIFNQTEITEKDRREWLLTLRIRLWPKLRLPGNLFFADTQIAASVKQQAMITSAIYDELTWRRSLASISSYPTAIQVSKAIKYTEKNLLSTRAASASTLVDRLVRNDQSCSCWTKVSMKDHCSLFIIRCISGTRHGLNWAFSRTNGSRWSSGIWLSRVSSSFLIVKNISTFDRISSWPLSNQSGRITFSQVILLGKIFRYWSISWSSSCRIWMGQVTRVMAVSISLPYWKNRVLIEEEDQQVTEWWSLLTEYPHWETTRYSPVMFAWQGNSARIHWHAEERPAGRFCTDSVEHRRL